MTEAADFVSYIVKPQLKTLGPKYGKLLGAIRNFFATCNTTELVKTVKSGEVYKTTLDGVDVEFSADDLLISSQSKEGFVAESDKGLTVVLDTTVTPELKTEGNIREIISKIQTMRKDAGFEVTDKINVYYVASGESKDAFTLGKEQISSVVLANLITEGDADGFTKEIDVNGELAKVTIVKA